MEVESFTNEVKEEMRMTLKMIEEHERIKKEKYDEFLLKKEAMEKEKMEKKESRLERRH